MTTHATAEQTVETTTTTTAPKLAGLWAHYAQDVAAERDGKPFPFLGGVTLYLRAMSNVDVRRGVQALALSRQAELEERTKAKLPMDPGMIDDQQLDTLVECVCTGWDGVTNPHTGDPLPFTKANARLVFTIARPLMVAALNKAGDDDAFKADRLEALAGNWPRTSRASSRTSSTRAASSSESETAPTTEA